MWELQRFIFLLALKINKWRFYFEICLPYGLKVWTIVNRTHPWSTLTVGRSGAIVGYNNFHIKTYGICFLVSHPGTALVQTAFILPSIYNQSCGKNLYQNDFLAKATFPHISYIFSQKWYSLVLSPAIKFSEAFDYYQGLYLVPIYGLKSAWVKILQRIATALKRWRQKKLSQYSMDVFMSIFLHTNFLPWQACSKKGYFLLTTLDWIRTFFHIWPEGW